MTQLSNHCLYNIMRSNQQLIKKAPNNLQNDTTMNQLNQSQVNQLPYLTKTQRRRSRSRSIGGRSARIVRQRTVNLIEEMYEDPVFFEDKLFCPQCDKQTYNVIQKKGGNLAWFCCALLSLMGGVCMFPFFCNGCLDSDVLCMQCGHLKRIDEAFKA